MDDDDRRRLAEVGLFAWLGEDELGSGEIGLKQARVPAGLVPLVATRRGKMDQEYIRDALQIQADAYGKRIHLCRYAFVEVVTTLEPHATGDGS